MERYGFNNFTVAKCENCKVVKLQESMVVGSKNWNNAQLENILCSCNLNTDEVSVCCSNIRPQDQTASLVMLVSFPPCYEWKYHITEETGRNVLRPKSLLNFFKMNVIYSVLCWVSPVYRNKRKLPKCTYKYILDKNVSKNLNI